MRKGLGGEFAAWSGQIEQEYFQFEIDTEKVVKEDTVEVEMIHVFLII